MARFGLGLRRLWAKHFLDNPASGAVLRKLGFAETGHAMATSRGRSGEHAAVLLACDLVDAGAAGERCERLRAPAFAGPTNGCQTPLPRVAA